MSRYYRHHLLSEIGQAGQDKLRQASVLLVGVGGLGSAIALYLTAAGVGRIGIVDADIVSLTNLQRQVLYSESQIGQPKVFAARERLEALNSEVKIECYPMRFEVDNGQLLVSKYDLIVDGTDNFESRYLINDYSIMLNKPYVYGSIGAFVGQVAIFNHEGSKSYRDLYPDQAALESLPEQESGVMGVVPGVVGTIQASEVVKLIVGAGSLLRNKLFTIDLLTMQTQIVEW